MLTSSGHPPLIVFSPKEVDPVEQRPQPPRLLAQVRVAVRTLHHSPRTEDAHVGWIRRIILFHGKRHSEAMGVAEVETRRTFRKEVNTLLAAMGGSTLLVVGLLYSSAR